jgi:hypothetical protein
MVDLTAIRQTIDSTRPGETAAVATREWLEEVERELTELEERRAKDPKE